MSITQFLSSGRRVFPDKRFQHLDSNALRGFGRQRRFVCLADRDEYFLPTASVSDSRPARFKELGHLLIHVSFGTNASDHALVRFVRVEHGIIKILKNFDYATAFYISLGYTRGRQIARFSAI